MDSKFFLQPGSVSETVVLSKSSFPFSVSKVLKLSVSPDDVIPHKPAVVQWSLSQEMPEPSTQFPKPETWRQVMIAFPPCSWATPSQSSGLLESAPTYSRSCVRLSPAVWAWWITYQVFFALSLKWGQSNSLRIVLHWSEICGARETPWTLGW